MRRTLKVGFAFTALVGMSALMAFANSDTVYPRAPMGPHFGGKEMVKRNDLGSSQQKQDAPGVPSKPRPVLESRSTPRGGTIGGHQMSSSGGGVAVASASPQVVLENRLKSLANDLR